LALKGFRVVIFTNQNGIAKGHANANDIKKKIETLQKELEIPLTALIATEDDMFRKPSLGMWKFFVDSLNGKVVVDVAKSFYCGDAAGRVKGKKKDFSDTDL
jgi:bifunctional polynucleotide phosphatase/kinase